MFDFRLRVFHTVARRLSFTKAGEELFISQPPVTKHIHELESHFRLQLFERNGNRIRLTEAGRTLLEHTEKIVEEYRKLEIEMGDLSSKKEGRLRIGASTTVAQYVLPRILGSFRQKYPGVQVTEAIKSYLTYRPCMAFVSIHAIKNEIDRGEYRLVGVKGLSIERPFFIITPEGNSASLIETFIRFAVHYNLK